MQKITPFLWFDNQAEQAVDFYSSLFENSKVLEVVRYGEQGPGVKGSVMTISFQLAGQKFNALNGGPYFGFTPAISFFVHCETEEQVDKLWEELAEGGTELMELGHYPFSEKYGWLQDKFGVSWQISLSRRALRISPFLMFVGEQHGKARQAIDLYLSLFENSHIVELDEYGAGETEPAGTVRRAAFLLEGQEFLAIDSHYPHNFTFTPAISFFVSCKSQEEVDRFWEKLSEGGTIEQCGWLKDRFGVSWQIIPSVLIELLGDKDPEKAGRVMQAMLKMTKIDIKMLQKAHEGS